MTSEATTAHLAARLGALRARLAENDLDALVVTHAANVRYLTNFAGSAGVVLVTGGDVSLLTDFRYRTAVDLLQSSGACAPGLVYVEVEGTYDEALAQRLLATCRERRVGFESGHMTVRQHRWLTRRLAGADQPRTAPAASASPLDFVPTTDVVEGLRAVKDDAEIGLLRAGARLLSGVAREVIHDLAAAGRRERDIAADIDWRLVRAGFERPAFDTIVASGPMSALPHARPGDRTIQDGDLVVLDFGGVLGGYSVDLTRTIVVGAVSDEARRLYRAVAEAQDAAMRAVAPGIGADAVDAAARNVLEAHGLGKVFGHGTGHGLGLEIHEEPRIGRPRTEGPPPAVLVAGMVCTIEPGAYLAGFGGVRLEDDILVTERGAECLTDVPRDPRLMTA